MPTMTREAWTDERMDDLVKHMDEGFRLARGESRELREDMRELRREIKAGFEQVDARFEKVDARLEKIDARFEKIDAKFVAKFDSLYRLMMGAMITLILSFVLTQI